MNSSMLIILPLSVSTHMLSVSAGEVKNSAHVSKLNQQEREWENTVMAQLLEREKESTGEAVSAAVPVDATPLLAKKKRSSSKRKDVTVTLADGASAPMDPLAPANVWQAVRRSVQRQFG
jgi:hypothetical protein